MADALTVSAIRLALDAVFTNGLTDGQTLSATHSFAFSDSLADGTSADQADKIWKSENRSLSGATSETIDVFDLASINIGAGAGKDCFGGSWATVEIVGLFVFNDTTSTGNLTIGADGTTACWNSIFNGDDEAAIGPIGPGGWFGIYRPDNPAFAVADSSNHLLKIASSASLTYDIWILARSA